MFGGRIDINIQLIFKEIFTLYFCFVKLIVSDSYKIILKINFLFNGLSRLREDLRD